MKLTSRQRLLLFFAVILMALTAHAVPLAPTNIQSTGTATTATCFPYNACYVVNCDALAYMLWGSSTVTVSKTRGNAAFGVPMPSTLYVTSKTGPTDATRCVSVISDSGTANCTLWPENCL